MATPVGDAIPLTGDPNKDALIQGGQWQFGTDPRVLTYSFSIETELGYQWSSALMDAVNLALEQYAAVANISFLEIEPGSDVDFSPADLALALTGDFLSTNIGALAIGFFPDPAATAAALESIGNTGPYPNPEGDVYFDHFLPPFQALGAGGSAREVALHEIGHALGLKHPFDGGSNDRPTANLDSSLTVMSSGALEAPLGSAHAVTPLLYDILAIQHIYGANMSYRTGDDLYLLGADGTERAIWDAGGVDTFDLSGAANGVIFELIEGAIVDLGGSARAAIAFGVTIENAIGTPFSDFIAGNAESNHVEGRGGSDILHGAAGADTLEGGVGNDTLNGGEGTDTLAGGAGDDRYVSLDLDLMIENADEGIDTWEIGESAQLPEHLESLKLTGELDLNGTGNASANLIIGNSGDNILDGRGGSDTLIGGAGNDFYVFNAGDVVIESGSSTDTALSRASFFSVPAGLENITLAAGAGNAWIGPSAADNHFVGNGGANLLQGGDGTDWLEGGRGDDTLLGGSGTDRLDGGRGTDVMEGGSGNDVYVVSGVRDQIVELAGGGIDTVEVTGARYILSSNLENAVVMRTAGARVTGNELANRLDGGAGNDTFEGGAGADLFVFNEEDGGVDRILDFVHGVDKIQLASAFFTSGPGSLFYDADSGALLYEGVQFAALGSGAAHPAFTAGDVQFV